MDGRAVPDKGAFDRVRQNAVKRLAALVRQKAKAETETLAQARRT